MRKPIPEVTLNGLINNNPLIEKISLEDINSVWQNIEVNDGKMFKNYLTDLKNLNNWQPNYWNLYNYIKSTSFKVSDGIYNPTYIAMRYNISIDDAINKVELKKSSKATNLKGFIARHGEVEGKILFEKFQQTSVSRSAEQTTHLERLESSVWCKEFYIKRGYDHETAVNMAREFNKKNSGANKWYWLGKGYTETEVAEILSATNVKKIFGIKEYIEKYGDEWHIKWDERIQKLRNTLNITHDMEIFNSYKDECWKYTNMSIKENPDSIDNLHLRGRVHDYQLDHIFSMKMGFISGIDPEIIGHITNLRCIPSFENNSKGEKCGKSIDELFEEYKQHESKKNHGN